MSTLGAIEPIGGAVAQEAHGQLYIDLMRQAMAAKDLGLRPLAQKTGISKSRLGRILHPKLAQSARSCDFGQVEERTLNA